MRGHAQAALRLAADDGQSVETPPSAEPQFMGHFYIANGYPMKGSDVDAQGRMHMLLECYPIPQGATPGQVRDMRFDKTEAVYMPYFGLMAMGAKDKGLVIGYTEFCYGVPRIGTPMEGVSDMTITKLESTIFPRPHTTYDTTSPRFGSRNGLIADIDEQIALEAKMKFIRSPKRPPVLIRRSIN